MAPEPEPVQLSPQAHQRLVEELEWRSGIRRAEISRMIEVAREHGDLKENADYDAAKNEQGHNEARVRQLESILKNAELVEYTDADVVTAGTLVEIRVEGDDENTTYLVGSIEERNDTYEVLSTSSPLGQALDGHAPGDTVSYQGPKRAFNVEIISVRPLN
jgi:transcription elongation factor GreA